MHRTRVKSPLLLISLFIVVTLACDLAVTVVPPTRPVPLSTEIVISVSAVPGQATSVPTQIPASPTSIPVVVVPSPTAAGLEASAGPLSVVIPPGLASTVYGSWFSRADGPDLPYWDLTPGHMQFRLEGYPLQAKSHEPQIYLYPAQAYAELVPAAFESIHRLDNILYGPGGTIAEEELPALPFFNAQQSFASNIQVISFQNGAGVRFVTEYAQYAISANNHDLFYHFQGVTRDGAYYIVAILPITVPVLAESSDAGAVLPIGGVPYSYFADPNADMDSYYAAVTTLLSATSPEAFSPSINQLDWLIQSLWVAP